MKRTFEKKVLKKWKGKSGREDENEANNVLGFELIKKCRKDGGEFRSFLKELENVKSLSIIIK